MNTKTILIVSVLLAFLIRFSAAKLVVKGFDGDEAAFGYYGYSLSTNLTDEYGSFLPLYFPSIGDYKYPVYAYLTALPVAVFGLNELSTRFISIVAGTLLVLVLYYLALELFEDKRIGLFAALITAISPYGIMFSSGAFESNLATFLVATGILFGLRFSRTQERKFGVLSVIFLLLASFTYSTSRLFLIMFLPMSFIILIKTIRSKKVIFFGIVGILSLIVIASLDIRSRVRAQDVAVFGKNNSSEFVTKELLSEDEWVFSGRKMSLLHIIHGETVIKSFDVIQNYFEHINPEYLFLNGNQNMPKYSVPKMGLFYLFEFVTMFIGVIYCAKSNKKRALIVLLWVALSPIASSLTIETPNPIRMLIGLPAFILLSSAGAFYLFNQKLLFLKRFIAITYGGVAFVFITYFWHQFTIHDVYHRPWYGDGGVKEMVSAVTELHPEYENVVIGGDPYIFFLFYNQVSPDEFIRDAHIVPESPGTWQRVERYKNIIFKMDVPCPKIGREKVLYVCKGNEIPQNSLLIKSITFNDSAPAFSLIEFVPYSKRQLVELPVNLRYMEQTDLSFSEGLLPYDSGRYW